jgi:hypothetical protein
MAKWADYLISSVEKDTKGNVVKVLLYKDHGEHISIIGIKTSAEVIALLKRNYTIKTILWMYPNWGMGAEVQIVNGKDGEYLRTNRNEWDEDNLDNLIPIYIGK